MKALIIRLKEKGDLTIGKLFLEDGCCYDTIELLWKNNLPRISCIPEGEYIINTDWSNNKARQVIELEGVPNRSQIQLHVATKASDLAGCIGFKTKLIESEVFNKLKEGGKIKIIKL